MTKKLISILVLLVVLIGIVTFEQVYTDDSINRMLENVTNLEISLNDEDLEASISKIDGIISMWDERESVICLFVDYRDIEQIGKQADLVRSHLGNADFELARVECNTLERVLETFRNMVHFDVANIL